jgi:hypothetical protein
MIGAPLLHIGLTLLSLLSTCNNIQNVSHYVISQPVVIYCIRNGRTVAILKVTGSKREAKTCMTMMSLLVLTMTVYSD